MSESSFLQLFRSRWHEMTRQFWPESPRQQLQDELGRIEAELGRRQNRLLSSRKRIEKLRYSLMRHQRNLARLVARTKELPEAADVRTKLVRQQRCVDRLWDRLQERERGYARRLGQLRKRKQEWAELRERLFSGCVTKMTDKESDPDDPF